VGYGVLNHYVSISLIVFAKNYQNRLTYICRSYIKKVGTVFEPHYTGILSYKTRCRRC